MVNKTENIKRYSRIEYIAGSAAPKYAPVPERRTTNVPERQNRPVRTTDKEKNTDRKLKTKPARRLDFVSTVFMIGMICITAYVCIGYLKLQSDMRQLNSQVIALTDDLTDLNDKNEGIRVSIEQAIDFDSVYEIAVGELGMVYPNNNKVYNYNYNNAGYVRQYSEIPSEEKELILEGLFKN